MDEIERINDSEIVFVTTTLYTKWLKYQSDIILRLFPGSEHIIVDGRKEWPNSWFYWIDKVKTSRSKYFIHIDEDFFITSREEIFRVIDKMDSEGVDVMGVPDGLHHYRGANPVAMNTFLLFGRIDKIRSIDFSGIRFGYDQNAGWVNNKGYNFKEKYKSDWKYDFRSLGGSNFKFEQEPYYVFFWKLKEIGCKFDYLFPSFDDRFKSTNPRFDEESPDIGIHMWYTRQWNSTMDVWGMRNIDRYDRVEKEILSNLNNI